MEVLILSLVARLTSGLEKNVRREMNLTGLWFVLRSLIVFERFDIYTCCQKCLKRECFCGEKMRMRTVESIQSVNIANCIRKVAELNYIKLNIVLISP